MRNQSLDY